MNTLITTQQYSTFSPTLQRIVTPKDLFFDIETTGLSAKNSYVYCIGFGYFRNDTYYVEQLFGEGPRDEPLLLTTFRERLRDYDRLISFNGISFDAHYLEEKYAQHNLGPSGLSMEHLDLFPTLSPYKKVWGLENMKQKTVEAFLDTKRIDPYTGGDLIKTYYRYLKEHNTNDYHDLLLHNAEDIAGLPRLLDLCAYDAFFHGGFQVEDWALQSENEDVRLTFRLHLPEPLCHSMSFVVEDLFVHARQEEALLRVSLFRGELKYFYEDYEHYWYFPEEDMAMHESVAEFSDRSHRKKATKKTAYQKNSGLFLPLYEGFVPEDNLPLFYRDAKKQQAYLRLTEDTSPSRAQSKAYCQSLLEYLLKNIH